MAGLLQHHHDRRHLDEGQEVDRLLLVPRRHAAVLLHLRPEPLHDVALLVQMPVDRAGLLAAAVRLHHDFSPAPADLFGQGVTIVARGGDHRGRLVVRQQVFGLLDGRLLGGRQLQLDRVPQRIAAHVDLGAEAAAATSQRLLALAPSAVPLFLDPAAQGWARITVESKMSHSRSGSRRASITRAQTPLAAQRSKRRQALFQLPNRSGRSRQGMPVRATYRTASTNNRLSAAIPPCCPGRPGSRSLMRSQSASESACRGRMAAPPCHWRRAWLTILVYLLSTEPSVRNPLAGGQFVLDARR